MLQWMSCQFNQTGSSKWIQSRFIRLHHKKTVLKCRIYKPPFWGKFAFTSNASTLKETMDAAFKEWAVVVAAIGRGDQIVIMRKGGIDEGENGFEIKHRKFWLFPTLFHQQRDMVVTDATKEWSVKDLKASQGTIPIQYACEVVTHIEFNQIEQIARLRGQHIWKDEVLIKRMTSGDRNCLHALLVKTFSLSKPHMIPMHQNYAGCKSWIKLQSHPPTDLLTPVLTEEAFKHKIQSFEQAIQ